MVHTSCEAWLELKGSGGEPHDRSWLSHADPWHRARPRERNQENLRRRGNVPARGPRDRERRDRGAASILEGERREVRVAVVEVLVLGLLEEADDRIRQGREDDFDQHLEQPV